MDTKKICIVITTRGNYGKMKSTMEAINQSNHCELQLVLGGGIISSRFGDYSKIVSDDGFKINKKLDFGSH